MKTIASSVWNEMPEYGRLKYAAAAALREHSITEVVKKNRDRVGSQIPEFEAAGRDVANALSKMTYAVLDEPKSGTGDIWSDEFDSLREAERRYESEIAHHTANELAKRVFSLVVGVKDEDGKLDLAAGYDVIRNSLKGE